MTMATSPRAESNIHRNVKGYCIGFIAGSKQISCSNYEGSRLAERLIMLIVRIPSVVYSIQENTVDEYTQTHSLNIIGSPGNLAAISNLAVEGSAFGRTLPRQPPNDL